MTKTKIEWTEKSWNPLTGCDKISTGCRNCYAERLAKRLKAMEQKNYRNGFKLTLHEDALSLPLKWKKPAMIFVNSMSDLFHEDVPFSFIRRVFSVMAEAHWHIFQVLTKRSSRLAKLSDQLKWSQNIWMGVSVENADFTYRISNLVSTGAAVKFLSLEPLLGPIPGLDLSGIEWVIVGGESGPGARPMESQWVNYIRDQCKKADIPFFFKQWGGTNKKKAGRLLDGRTWSEMPRTAVL
jgi:protein gp37